MLRSFPYNPAALVVFLIIGISLKVIIKERKDVIMRGIRPSHSLNPMYELNIKGNKAQDETIRLKRSIITCISWVV